MGADYGGDEPDAKVPEKRPPPFTSPFKTAKEFGITEKTAKFMGLRAQADAEFLVPALRLDLKEATADEVEAAMVDAFCRLEAKYGSLDNVTFLKLDAAVTAIRLQVLAAQTRRAEVCQFIKSTADPKHRRHNLTEPEMVLTDDEVKFWMRQHRESFEGEDAQVRRRAHEKYKLKFSARHIDQRQGSRFTGFLKHYFGGTQCIQSYLKDRTFLHWYSKKKGHVDCTRILPALSEEDQAKAATKKPDDEIKRYSNKRSAKVQAKARRRYFEGLARDLANPNSRQAKARTTKRFTGLLTRMENARACRAYFHDPQPQRPQRPQSPCAKSKGTSKGSQQISTTERWTSRLVAAGLDVGPYTDRLQHEQQQQQQQQAHWHRHPYYGYGHGYGSRSHGWAQQGGSSWGSSYGPAQSRGSGRGGCGGHGWNWQHW